MRASTNIRPKQFHGKEDAPRAIVINNPSGVNLYVGEDDEILSETGIPVPPAGTLPLNYWSGDLWISADVDGTIFTIIKSQAIVIPEGGDR